MAIIGVTLDKKNPPFKLNDFLFWMPQFTKFFTIEGEYQKDEDGYDQPKWKPGKDYIFKKLKDIADHKIFKSIFGSDWEYAMSLCMAHYLTIQGKRESAPSGESLSQIAGGGVTKGLLTSVGVGNFSKSYDIEKGMVTSDDAKWWNLTSYGSELMTLLKTKAVPSVFVVTNNNVPGA